MTTPGQGVPANLDYIYQITDMSDSDDHSEAGIEQALGVPINDSWTTARTEFGNNVTGRFVDIEEELIGSGTVLSDHENRITHLETGDVVAEYFSNDVWSKPATTFHHHEFVGIAGGGGGRRPSFVFAGTPRGHDNYGGGQGGYGGQSVNHGDVGATVNIVIGNPGAGGGTDGMNGNPGMPTTFTDSGGNILTCGGGPGGSASPPTVGAGTFPEWAANGGRGGFVQSGSSIANPTNGGAGYLAPGGQTTSGDGGNGGNCPAGRIGPGGGGAGGHTHSRGGNGGFPGGAGGGGGGNVGTGATGRGGNGAVGRAIVISSVSA